MRYSSPRLIHGVLRQLLYREDCLDCPSSTNGHHHTDAGSKAEQEVMLLPLRECVRLRLQGSYTLKLGKSPTTTV